MFETLLLQGNRRLYLENSGPGSKYILKGDNNFGYMGLVSEDELFTAREIIDQCGLGAFAIEELSGKSDWHKFIRLDRVFYIRRSPVVSNVSWANIYEKGLMFGLRKDHGDRSAGPYSLEYHKKEQFVYRQKYEEEPRKDPRTWTLKFRSIKGLDDPLNDENHDTANEWSMFISNVVDEGTNFFGREFYEDLWGTEHGQITTARNKDGSEAKFRGRFTFDGMSTDDIHKQEPHYAWTPVVELVLEGEVALDIVDLRVEFDESLPSLEYNITYTLGYGIPMKSIYLGHWELPERMHAGDLEYLNNDVIFNTHLGSFYVDGLSLIRSDVYESNLLDGQNHVKNTSLKTFEYFDLGIYHPMTYSSVPNAYAYSDTLQDLNVPIASEVPLRLRATNLNTHLFEVLPPFNSKYENLTRSIYIDGSGFVYAAGDGQYLSSQKVRHLDPIGYEHHEVFKLHETNKPLGTIESTIKNVELKHQSRHVYKMTETDKPKGVIKDVIRGIDFTHLRTQLEWFRIEPFIARLVWLYEGINYKVTAPEVKHEVLGDDSRIERLRLIAPERTNAVSDIKPYSPDYNVVYGIVRPIPDGVNGGIPSTIERLGDLKLIQSSRIVATHPIDEFMYSYSTLLSYVGYITPISGYVDPAHHTKHSGIKNVVLDIMETAGWQRAFNINASSVIGTGERLFAHITKRQLDGFLTN